MSRQIDLTQPLSDEDRAYLVSRGRDDLIAFADQSFGAPNDNDLGTQSPAAVGATLAENQQSAPAPTLTPQTGLSAEQAEASADQGDGNAEEAANYDDAEAWSYEDLKDEVKARREAGADDAPALNSSREDLVKWLFEDDAR